MRILAHGLGNPDAALKVEAAAIDLLGASAHERRSRTWTNMGACRSPKW